jgi:hypothetical protein
MNSPRVSTLVIDPAFLPDRGVLLQNPARSERRIRFGIELVVTSSEEPCLQGVSSEGHLRWCSSNQLTFSSWTVSATYTQSADFLDELLGLFNRFMGQLPWRRIH